MNLPAFLTLWPYGQIVLTGHRIGLYHVIAFHKDGLSPEQINEQYPSLPLDLIHQVLGFYRDNQAEVDAYVAHADEEIERLRATTPRVYTLEELQHRYDAKKQAEAK
jgi:uncharacterized protein (DUF433 family)